MAFAACASEAAPPLGGSEALSYRPEAWLTATVTSPAPTTPDALDDALDRLRAALHADFAAKRGPFTR
jgi:hypothetical protein